MKTLAILLVVALIFAIIVVAALYLILRAINEERKATCGKCDYYDTSLQHCWMRGITCGTRDKGCLTYHKREKDEED